MPTIRYVPVMTEFWFPACPSLGTGRLPKRSMSTAFEVVVVGSGAGGAAVAHELAKRGRSVLVLEAGPDVKESHLGGMFAAAVSPGYYDRMALFSRSVEGSIIYHTSNLGGTTVFACGNMVRNSEIERRISFDFGMAGLSECFDEAENESTARPLPLDSIVGLSRRLMEGARSLGYDARPASKGFVDRWACKACGNCIFGCRYGAKWDSRRYLTSASVGGATIRTGTRVERLLLDGTTVKGVVVTNRRGRERIESEAVVVAAGALNTPVILQASGIECGKGLFVDYFACVYGIADRGTQLLGQTMSFLIDESREQGFMISPFVDDQVQYLLFCPLSRTFSTGFSRRHLAGLLVKIGDDRAGWVAADGTIHKAPTPTDRATMQRGLKVAGEILEASGARKLVTTQVWRGAHPGGTAAIGETVGNDLKVRGMERLYVCDASVLPFAPGLPPILTITAMGKWLGKRV